MSRKIIILLLGLCLVLLTMGCATTGSAKSSGSKDGLSIIGVVFTPNNQPVSGIEVRTEPASEIVVTDAQGAFIIQRGLMPGVYELIAETSDGNKGTTRIGLAYSDEGPSKWKIVLGMKLDMRMLKENDLRETLGKSQGEKRVGGK
ncbi:carboxypeptidase regulatory-like domain-containing protein [bacterium]|nr:carboxypeptidase regulatory-like domain-containing protein [bacterium]